MCRRAGSPGSAQATTAAPPLGASTGTRLSITMSMSISISMIALSPVAVSVLVVRGTIVIYRAYTPGLHNKIPA